MKTQQFLIIMLAVLAGIVVWEKFLKKQFVDGASSYEEQSYEEVV